MYVSSTATSTLATRRSRIKTSQCIHRKRYAELSRANNIHAGRIIHCEELESIQLCVGDLVLLRRGTELSGSKFKSFMWIDPVEIIEATHARYRLKSLTGRETHKPIHVHLLRLYHARHDPVDNSRRGQY